MNDIVISNVFQAFLQAKDKELNKKEAYIYTTTLDLLEKHLNESACHYLTPEDEQIYDKRYAEEHLEFSGMFGADKIEWEAINEFFGVYLPKQTNVGEEVKKEAPIVVKYLTQWMAKQGYTKSNQTYIPELVWVDRATNIMDSFIRIPVLNIRFGLDAIVGLIPFWGEVATYSVSGLMVMSMVRHGVSGRVMVLMVWNLLLDTLIGLIPLIGDLYDFRNKANVRNLRLLKQHQLEGKHEGSGWGMILLAFGLIAGILLLIIFVLGALALTAWNYLMGLL